jgi:hypothetical protein
MKNHLVSDSFCKQHYRSTIRKFLYIVWQMISGLHWRGGGRGYHLSFKTIIIAMTKYLSFYLYMKTYCQVNLIFFWRNLWLVLEKILKNRQYVVKTMEITYMMLHVGHFTHVTEGPNLVNFKYSHWWKGWSWSKFAPHYAWGTNGVSDQTTWFGNVLDGLWTLLRGSIISWARLL